MRKKKKKINSSECFLKLQPNLRKSWGGGGGREGKRPQRSDSARVQTVAQLFPGSSNPTGFLLQLLVTFKSARGEVFPFGGRFCRTDFALAQPGQGQFGVGGGAALCPQLLHRGGCSSITPQQINDLVSALCIL